MSQDYRPAERHRRLRGKLLAVVMLVALREVSEHEHPRPGFGRDASGLAGGQVPVLAGWGGLGVGGGGLAHHHVRAVGELEGGIAQPGVHDEGEPLASSGRLTCSTVTRRSPVTRRPSRLDLAAQQQTFVRLEDLSVPYAASICEHLFAEDRQSTSARSRFLDACRSRNRGELDAAQLAEVTVQLGFNNVIDAFHISRGGEPT